jgi:hypothetical protein
MAKNQGSNAPQISEIDDDVSDITGKRVFYFLTDEEGGTNGPGGRKVAAILAQTYHPQRRNEAGQIVSNIFVMVNGGFNKDAALDSSRQPGTFDIFHDGDRTN